MMVTYSLQIAVAVLVGIVLGVVCYRAWSARMAKNKAGFPGNGNFGRDPCSRVRSALFGIGLNGYFSTIMFW